MYTQLDAATAAFAKSEAETIKALAQKSAQLIIEIGQHLQAVKERLPHGAFGQWLELEFNWTERTARNYMNLADKFKTETVSDLNISLRVLYFLARETTPEAARWESLAQARESGSLTMGQAQNIVDRYTQPEPTTQPIPTANGDTVLYSHTVNHFAPTFNTNHPTPSQETGLTIIEGNYHSDGPSQLPANLTRAIFIDPTHHTLSEIEQAIEYLQQLHRHYTGRFYNV